MVFECFFFFSSTHTKNNWYTFVFHNTKYLFYYCLCISCPHTSSHYSFPNCDWWRCFAFKRWHHDKNKNDPCTRYIDHYLLFVWSPPYYFVYGYEKQSCDYYFILIDDHIHSHFFLEIHKKIFSFHFLKYTYIILITFYVYIYIFIFILI